MTDDRNDVTEMTFADKTGTEKRNAVEASLLAQLAANGADSAPFRDLVGDYMALWAIKERLIEDTESRGVVYRDVSSVGVEMFKKNSSTTELINVNKQMLALLDKLKLNAGEAAKVADVGDL